MPTECEYRIAVCDDNDQDRANIAGIATHILQDAQIRHRISCYQDAKTLLSAIHNGEKYDLLLQDIQMDEMDGMELARELRRQKNNTAIVLISVCREMALQGYRVAASRYLVKPVEREELEEAIVHCHAEWHRKKEILLPTSQGQHRTSFSEIQFVEAFDRGTRFVLTHETVETKLKFSEAEAMLPKSSFVLCHRAFIVNLAQTKRISQYEFTMKSGAVIPISRLRYNEINRQFVSYMTD